MKKLYSLLASLFLGTILCVQVSAQSASIVSYDPLVQDPTNAFVLESHVWVENTSTQPVSYKITRTIGNINPAFEESFCFGTACFAPGTVTSNTATTLQPGTSEDLKASVNPWGTCGTASLHYSIWNINNPADSVGVTLGFEFCANGIADSKADYGISKPLNNPADAFTVVNYKLPNNQVSDKLMIYNMLGTLVKSVDIPGSRGALVLNTSELKSGVYLISYNNGGKSVSTSKLVVKHQ